MDCLKGGYLYFLKQPVRSRCPPDMGTLLVLTIDSGGINILFERLRGLIEGALWRLEIYTSW